MTDLTLDNETTPDRRRAHFPEWLYLAFLGFIFLTPSFDPDSSTSDWVAAGVIVVLTAATFVAGRQFHRLVLPGAIALMLIGFVGIFFETSAMGVLPIYAAALSASQGTRRQVVGRLAAITLVTLAAIPMSPIPMPFLALAFVPALVLIWMVGMSVFDERSLNVEAHQLRAENARIQYLATVTERERIARDLHDLAGHALTAVTLRSQLVQRLAESDPDRVRAEAAAIEETARETLASLRETVAGWQQVYLKDELDKGRAALTAAEIDLEVRGEWGVDLAPSVETVLALALREAVTNVVRHSHASRCDISLDREDTQVVLTVGDDGQGTNRPEGTGLRGMRERVSAAGGRLAIHSQRGMTVTVTLPVAAP